MRLLLLDYCCHELNEYVHETRPNSIYSRSDGHTRPRRPTDASKKVIRDDWDGWFTRNSFIPDSRCLKLICAAGSLKNFDHFESWESLFELYSWDSVRWSLFFGCREKFLFTRNTFISNLEFISTEFIYTTAKTLILLRYWKTGKLFDSWVFQALFNIH